MSADWNIQLAASFIWLGKAFLITLVCLVPVLWLASRFTRWGRQFRQLAWPYLRPGRGWKPLLTIALMLLLALFSVRMSVLFSFWYNGFYSALQDLNIGTFWFLLGVFSVLATIHVALALLTYYIGQAFEIRWRSWLNDWLTQDWLAGDAYYRTQFLDVVVDNPDQRIERDIAAFVNGSRTLFFGAVSALVSLVEFTEILWGLSGPLTIAGVDIPRAMILIVYLYVIIATLIAFKLGHPLIRLNFMNEKLSANFRYALMRLREYAENVAFYQGGAVENRTLWSRFSALIANLWALVFRTLKFDGFNLAVTQAAVVFPFIVQAPRFFSGAIKLGDVIQTSQAFGQVQDSLSFFRTSYDAFAQYRATLDRLTGFLDANTQARALPAIAIETRANTLDVAGLRVQRPDGKVLLDGLTFAMQPGQTLLIKGPSGSGKTTLLRALAGLWPHAEGQVRRPTGTQALFLSQRPYLPLGSLRDALAYPATASAADDSRINTVLHQVSLGHLSARLDDVTDWSRILSIGEQQRLAFARVLFNRPQLAFLDEATSATDEGLEHALYSLLRTELPDCMLVSIGHRSTLDAFHAVCLQLDGQGAWHLNPS
ncbi:ABC transporter ATP-binding protein/permease [Pigmentiphaga aceris]|uniref:ABC transporter ATP-binding protein/permease n=1 Tax=Pigmentiphaga aceris TaxID=1940612 RepID=A0A5C0ASZ4_9BURK|nr:ABC transporter ATP-binding protein/permease [Pigmentiphaga aceris]QEI05439.1 ABC transporter ATP-binding protein/permease [Pigmentiphaga aceris]